MCDVGEGVLNPEGGDHSLPTSVMQKHDRVKLHREIIIRGSRVAMVTVHAHLSVSLVITMLNLPRTERNKGIIL